MRSKLSQFKIGNGNEFLDLFSGDKCFMERGLLEFFRLKTT